MDINTIRAWLGHVSLNTTNVYAEIDLETKARALALCEVKHGKRAKPWHRDKGLMAFLQALYRTELCGVRLSLILVLPQSVS